MSRLNRMWGLLLAVTAIGAWLPEGHVFAQDDPPGDDGAIVLSTPEIRAVWLAHGDKPKHTEPPQQYGLNQAPLRVLVGNIGIGDMISVRSPQIPNMQPIASRGGEVTIRLPSLPRGDHLLVAVSNRAQTTEIESDEIRLRIGFPPPPRIEAIGAEDGPLGPLEGDTVSISAGDEILVSVAGVLSGDQVRVYLKNDEFPEQFVEAQAGADGQPVTMAITPPAVGKEYTVTATILRGDRRDQSPHSKPVTLEFQMPSKQNDADGANASLESTHPDYAIGHQPIVEPLPTADEVKGMTSVTAARVYDKGFDRLEDVKTSEAAEKNESARIVQYRFQQTARFPRASFGRGGEQYDQQGLTIFEGMQLLFHSSGRYEVRFATSSPTMPVDLQLQFGLNQNPASGQSHTLFTLPLIRISPSNAEESTRTVPRQLRHVGYSPVVQNYFSQISEAANAPIGELNGSIAYGRFSRSGSARFGYGFDFR